MRFVDAGWAWGDCDGLGFLRSLVLFALLVSLFEVGWVVGARVVHVVQLVERESVHVAVVVWQRSGLLWRGELGGGVGVHCAGIGSCCGGEEGGAGAVSLRLDLVVIVLVVLIV